MIRAEVLSGKFNCTKLVKKKKNLFKEDIDDTMKVLHGQTI